MGLIEDALARQATQPAPRRIDYDRMNKVMPKQKAALTRAVNAYRAIPDPRDLRGDARRSAEDDRAEAAERVAAVCKAAILEWNEIGAWPDQWATWQCALDDVLPWNQSIDLRDL